MTEQMNKISKARAAVDTEWTQEPKQTTVQTTDTYAQQTPLQPKHQQPRHINEFSIQATPQYQHQEHQELPADSVTASSRAQDIEFLRKELVSRLNRMEAAALANQKSQAPTRARKPAVDTNSANKSRSRSSSRKRLSTVPAKPNTKKVAKKKTHHV